MSLYIMYGGRNDNEIEYGVDSFVTQEDGTLLFSFGFTDKESIKSWVLSFREGIELLEPAEVRGELESFGMNLAKKYCKS